MKARKIFTNTEVVTHFLKNLSLPLLFFFLVFAVGYTAQAEEPVFTFKVSGELLKHLPDDAEFRTLKLPFDISKYKDGDALPMTRVKVTDLPVSIPAEPHLGIGTTVYFWSPTQKSLFTISLSNDLFDKPRVINILLNKPQATIRPGGSFFGFARYRAMITQRMEYEELPRIDPATQNFMKPIPPNLKVIRLKTGDVIHEAPMEVGCMESRWWGVFSDDRHASFKSMGFKHKETYRFSVEYDSGGLFPPILSTCDFTYDEWRH